MIRWLALSLVAWCVTVPAADLATTADDNGQVEQIGRLLPRTDDTLRFRTDDGRSYPLLRNRMSNALFVDTNFQSKLLLLKGRFTTNDMFEVTGNLRSIADGRTNEVFYFCDICAIQQIDPGPCMCCREPVVLTEKPVP